MFAIDRCYLACIDRDIDQTFLLYDHWKSQTLGIGLLDLPAKWLAAFRLIDRYLADARESS